MAILTYAAAQVIRVLPRAAISKAVGRVADLPWPRGVGRGVVDAYCKAYDVNLSDYLESEWSSFDNFFTRTLRPGARPLPEDASVAVCPADGRCESAARIGADTTFLVKGRPYQVEELIGEDPSAFAGGGGSVVYLSPRDYHRVHSPVAGVITHVRSLPGDYFPVNAIGLKHIPSLFVRNRRVAVFIETPGGRAVVVLVAAIVVGRITATGIDARDVPFGLHTLDLKIERGAEIGIFHLGSTAVVLFDQKLFKSWACAEGPVRFGEAFAHLNLEGGVR
jgi:phosphatidylserine decarboxylase